jgi:dolichyl-diphosphooligosaccharide--protein glycosyltransferase
MRSYPVKYGYYLNEFDPYFNYRATKYIVDNGLDSYWKWNDTMSWYPEGRDVLKSSQTALHIVTFILYNAFGRSTTLMDFTIIFPVIIGSLTTIVMYALVRAITNSNTAGMLSALFFAFSPAIIQRGNLGWFKSEPLGLFFGLISIYLLISATKHKELKYVIPKAAIGGLILGLANASWGGAQYFSIPISLFFMFIPFFRRDTATPLYVAVIFTVFTMMSAAAFPRPGISFIFGLPGITLLVGTVFLVNAHFLKTLIHPNKYRLATLFLLSGFIIAAVGAIATQTYYASDFRYINTAIPFFSQQISITATVSEHYKPTLVDYFTNFSVLLMFAGLGIWISFKERDYLSVFALILGITAVYVSSSLGRLLVFASVGIIVLACMGLYRITQNIFQGGKESPPLPHTADKNASSNTKAPLASSSVEEAQAVKKRFGFLEEIHVARKTLKIVYMALIILILTLPLVYPPDLNWIASTNFPPTILYGGSDWIDALTWTSKYTQKDAVIAAWWDWGYWITTLANRASLADNATINQTRIAELAKMFIGKPEDGIKLAASHLRADYILVYVAAQPISINNSEYYLLDYGGDESLTPVFMKTAGLSNEKYMNERGYTATFWNDTLIGKLIPFTPVGYTSFIDKNPTKLVEDYRPGAYPVYSKQIKYPKDSMRNEGHSGSLSLAYYTNSFNNTDSNTISAVLIYKIIR